MKIRNPWFCQDCRDVLMEYNKKGDFYRCPKCGAELWPADTHAPTGEIEELMSELAATHRQTECKPAGPPAKGSGSKSKGRSRKTDMKKKSLATLNMALGFSDTRGGKA